MSIRPATEDDIDAVRRVAQRCWTSDYPEILTRETAEEAVTEWYAPEVLSEELRQDRTLLLVAEKGEAVVGFSHATWRDTEPADYVSRSYVEPEPEGNVLRIYVHPDHRRENVGRALLGQTCTALGERGVDRINAMVLAENEPGNAFYRRFGFENVDEGETTIGNDAYRERRYVLEGTVVSDGD